MDIIILIQVLDQGKSSHGDSTGGEQAEPIGVSNSGYGGISLNGGSDHYYH